VQRAGKWSNRSCGLAAIPRLPLGLPDYVKVVHDAINRLDVTGDARDVVLVGHSLGALTVTMVAAQRQVAGLVFVGGIIPMPGKSLADLAEVDADRDLPMGENAIEMFDDGTFIFTADAARRLLYHDCAESVADEAIRQLRRQRSLWTAVCDIERWPDTRLRSIVGTKERLVNPEWSTRIARQRLGIEPEYLESGHSGMLSQPAALADLLVNGA
jgi:pimeloyl-ACP methyl ester carboxylesterase